MSTCRWLPGARSPPRPAYEPLEPQIPAVLQIPTGHLVAGHRLDLVTPRLVERVHAMGKHVHVWTIDDADEMHRLFDLGVDGIVSDRIDTLADVLAERGVPLRQ